MSRRLPELDDDATFAGILLGMLLGALFALTRIKRRGDVARKDVTQFGAGSAELQVEASLTKAKAKAKARLDADG